MEVHNYSSEGEEEGFEDDSPIRRGKSKMQICTEQRNLGNFQEDFEEIECVGQRDQLMEENRIIATMKDHRG